MINIFLENSDRLCSVWDKKTIWLTKITKIHFVQVLVKSWSIGPWVPVPVDLHTGERVFCRPKNLQTIDADCSYFADRSLADQSWLVRNYEKNLSIYAWNKAWPIHSAYVACKLVAFVTYPKCWPILSFTVKCVICAKCYWPTKSTDFCLTVGRFLLGDFICNQNQPTLSVV